ncbi:MAG: phosphate-starvation-inducible PsiE family protein [Desulfomonilaceae bacterium]
MRFSDAVNYFERLICYTLMSMMAVVILMATLDVGRVILRDILTPSALFLDSNELLDLFGMLLLVLIGMELLETIYVFHKDRVVSAEIILIVALVAMARKVITLDQSKLSSFTFFDTGVLMLSLAGAYFLLKRSQKNGKKKFSGENISLEE